MPPQKAAIALASRVQLLLGGRLALPGQLHQGRQTSHLEKRDDGSPAYTPLVGASILVFFALAMQCLSTLAVLKKETRSWRWPAFVFSYMTLLAWFSAFLVYQGGLLLGLG